MNYAASLFPQTYWGSRGASKSADSLARQSLSAALHTGLVGAKITKVVDELGTVANAHGLLSHGPGLGIAIAFIAALPADMAPPEVSIDPDGEVAFDWCLDDAMLSVSLGPTGRLTYAWDIENGPKSDSAHFVGQIPKTLAEAIRRFT
jgi:hypothetical protein